MPIVLELNVPLTKDAPECVMEKMVFIRVTMSPTIVLQSIMGAVAEEAAKRGRVLMIHSVQTEGIVKTEGA